MSNFPAVSGQRLIKALRKLGFEVIRSKGSHNFLQHADGRCTVVPVHADCEISIEELKKFL
jgi:predicted RNA binding protein YcfA (HicA-like mRNA interferase family)